MSAPRGLSIYRLLCWISRTKTQAKWICRHQPIWITRRQRRRYRCRQECMLRYTTASTRRTDEVTDHVTRGRPPEKAFFSTDAKTHTHDSSFTAHKTRAPMYHTESNGGYGQSAPANTPRIPLPLYVSMAVCRSRLLLGNHPFRSAMRTTFSFFFPPTTPIVMRCLGHRTYFCSHG